MCNLEEEKDATFENEVDMRKDRMVKELIGLGIDVIEAGLVNPI